jgi:hypothetical protein
MVCSGSFVSRVAGACRACRACLSSVTVPRTSPPPLASLELPVRKSNSPAAQQHPHYTHNNVWHRRNQVARSAELATIVLAHCSRQL